MISDNINKDKKSRIKVPELMAPAGDWTMLRTAIQYGANAVYFGVDKLNMRASAKNFSVRDLPKISEFCHSNNVLSYLTLNSIVYESELKQVEKIIKIAKESGISRIICWDLSVVEICKEYEIPFCISTQASVSNSYAIDFYKKIGATRIVLARECTLSDIKKIRKKTDLELEVFIHGAMCVAISGRCFMSHHLFNKSANRGECLQPCRREYEIYDPSIGKSLLIGEDYVMSPKDLCTIEFIDKIIQTGVDSLKIEGRKRSPEYVATTVSVYRKAIDLYFEKKLTKEVKSILLDELKTVYNKGFSSGFYFGTPSSEDYSSVEGSLATTRKKYIGKVLNFYKKNNVVHILVESGSLKLNDDIIFIGETTGLLRHKIFSFKVNDKDGVLAKKGDEITLIVDSLVRRNDKVYKIETVN
ncbi:MAG: U32 family peptidase [Ignavibacterium sp.]|nr:U32 family peptidase [Ignavibacterium sp.]MDW8374600.1 peptidase U32 family protein [Ignavibacteriales bacterium]